MKTQFNIHLPPLDTDQCIFRDFIKVLDYNKAIAKGDMVNPGIGCIPVWEVIHLIENLGFERDYNRIVTMWADEKNSYTEENTKRLIELGWERIDRG